MTFSKIQTAEVLIFVARLENFGASTKFPEDYRKFEGRKVSQSEEIWCTRFEKFTEGDHFGMGG